MDIKINNKFVAYRGCIGRREYFLNNIYLAMINTFLTLPLSFWMVTHSQTAIDMFNFPQLIKDAPVFASFFYWFTCLISVCIGFGLVVRRLVDIFGVENSKRIYIFSGIVVLIPYLWLFKTNPLTALLLIINIIFALIILFTPGKITGQLPADEVKRFNWGAFWGTWIWGFFNRVYITLWALPLYFTPAAILASLVCGIKGNEWAYEKSKNKDLEAFHRGQKHQAIGWNIFAGFVIVILPVLLTFLLVGFIVASAIKNPDSLNQFINKTENVIEMIIDEEFEEYKLDVDENRFYIDPQEWVNMSFDERYNLLKGAATFASLKKHQSDDEKYKNYSGSRSTEMSITKIYSSYNGELLGEFSIDASEIKDFKSAIKSMMKSVKFNTTPELPPPLPPQD